MYDTLSERKINNNNMQEYITRQNAYTKNRRGLADGLGPVKKLTTKAGFHYSKYSTLDTRGPPTTALRLELDERRCARHQHLRLSLYAVPTIHTSLLRPDQHPTEETKTICIHSSIQPSTRLSIQPSTNPPTHPLTHPSIPLIHPSIPRQS